MRPRVPDSVGEESLARAFLQPKGFSVQVEQIGDELVLKERLEPGRINAGVGFLLFWWVSWSIGCTFIVERTIRYPDLEAILFAVPILDAWFFVLLVLGLAVFGRTYVRLGPGGLEQGWTVLGWRGKRNVALDEIKGVTEYERVVDSETGRTEHGIKIATLGRSIRFGVGSDAEERPWLVELLEERLRTLTSRSPAVLEPVRPSDSEFTLRREGDRMVFIRDFPSCRGAIAAMTFLNLFWNGLIANFLLQLARHFDWFVFLFLIPFEVVGIFLVVAWLSALTLPWQRWEWSFDPTTITARVSIWGFGHTRHYDALCLDQIERRNGTQCRRWLPPRVLTEDPEDRSFSLGIVDGDGRDIFAIVDLTKGEARWIEYELRPLLKNYFSRPTIKALPERTEGPLWDRWLDGSN
jgi:hypothetical protein